jgi:hypothetical protein
LFTFRSPSFTLASPTTCGIVNPEYVVRPRGRADSTLWVLKRNVLNGVVDSGVVTCCFTANQEVLRLFVNEIDVLSEF